MCLTRTLVLARLFPFISHNFWDGPYGCVMAGCLACGGSIWLENGKRRGEMSLYVLPRAVRACLPERWIKQGGPRTRFFERCVQLRISGSPLSDLLQYCVRSFACHTLDISFTSSGLVARTFPMGFGVCYQWTKRRVLEEEEKRPECTPYAWHCCHSGCGLWR